MKAAKIVFLVFLLFVISCDKDNGNPYPDPDEMNVSDGDEFVDADDQKNDTDTVDKDSDEPDFDKIDDDPDDGPDGFDPDDPSNDDDDYIDEDIDDDPTPDIDIPSGVCGNGITGFGEECDNGAFNSDAPGTIGLTCRTDCTYARCGDNVIDTPNELCDDGNAEDGDYCGANCMTIFGSCGDGKQQGNEECDKATAGEGIGEYCSDDCLSIVGFCGDGIRQSHELCDNAELGEGIGPYYCGSDCKSIIGSCGDSILQDNEDCDDGDDNGRYGFCAAVCSGLGRRCGDGKRDISYELCDDGNNEGDDYCSADCQIELGRCGDGVVQLNEQCDKAIFGDGTGVYCSDDCQTVLGECGDETVQDNEDCDWGTDNGNSYCEYGVEESCSTCNAVCNFVSGLRTFCGDGKIDGTNGESCDNATSDIGIGEGIGVYCSFDCTEIVGYCGDGAIQSNEVCDKAGLELEYCSDDCKSIIASCGDGTLQETVEECDNGENNINSCQYDETSCTVCSTECEIKPGTLNYCGDDRVDSEYEYCDSGNNNGKYKTEYPGYCNDGCQGIGAGGYCGDGTRQESDEACDNGEDNGASECEYGTETCDVCTPGCATAPAIGKYCGDGQITNGENCDDGEVDNGTYGHCNTECTGMGESCGNGAVDGTEVCDSGVNNGTYGYCSSTCTGMLECGDGISQTPDETCDSGADNGVYRLNAPGNCNAGCQGIGDAGYCGNSVVETGNEDCDHGGLITTDCVYGYTECKVCDNECKEQDGNVSYCGDGFTQVTDGETCDDGVNNGNYGYCAEGCKSEGEFCGDGIENGTEACDDGVENGTPGHCNSDCSGEVPYCGDNIQNGTEICDNGIDNGKYGYCKIDCTGPGERCGDDVLQTGEGEICDDGYSNGSYGHCKSDCSGQGPYCGDGSTTDGETCDDGGDNGTYGHCRLGCSEMGPYCGDGYITDSEICDDGVDNGTYEHCMSYCSGMGPYCGDGSATDGETCDDGVDNGTYGHCQVDCSDIGLHCGDGDITNGEFCDDGVDNGTYDHCNAECSGIVESCGDGVVQSSEGEVCDDGFFNGTQGYCKSDCSGPVEYCGDGSQNGSEACDDGGSNGDLDCDIGESSCLRCNLNCELVPGDVVGYCGDDILQEYLGEECDHGGFVNYFCEPREASCEVCGPECTYINGILNNYCGDGILQSEYESCDSGVNNGSYRLSSPGYCDGDCQGYGEGGFCGDSSIQTVDGEECDDGVDNGTSSSTCFTDCRLKGTCGNDIIEAGEICDGGAPVLCSELSDRFSSGTETATCLSNCGNYDYSSCTPDDIERFGIFYTGQELCYDNSASISCPANGASFYGQDSQYPYPEKTFTPENNYLVTEYTSLRWMLGSPLNCTVDGGSKCTYTEAEDYCFSIDGKTWHLPLAQELQYAANYGASSKPLSFTNFNVTADRYMTRTIIGLGESITAVYVVDFNDGSVYTILPDDGGKVICVSNDMIQVSEFQEETCSDVVKDGYYGLKWLRLNILAQSWEDALEACESSTDENHSFWRLPNINELQTILNDRDSVPASTMPGIGMGTIWSATTDPLNNAGAYVIDTSDGSVSSVSKGSEMIVYCISDIPDLIVCP